VIICLELGAACLRMVQLMPLHSKTPSSRASFESRLVLPFCCRLTEVVLEKRPLNGCSGSGSYVFMNRVIAKFHQTGPTGPDQTKSADFVEDPGLVGSGPVGSV